MQGELDALADKFESWEQAGQEAMNEYQNYKAGGQASGGHKQRAGSVGASSRLRRPAQSGKNKVRNSDLASDEDQGSEEEVDLATSLKM